MKSRKENELKQPPFNWIEAQSYINSVERSDTILMDERLKSYILLQEFLKKNQSVDFSRTVLIRDYTISTAIEFELNLPQAARLFLSLSSFLTHFKIGSAWENAPSEISAFNALSHVMGPIGRLAKFSSTDTKQKSRALTYVKIAADRWAEVQDDDELQRHGFRRTPFGNSGEFLDYESDVVINNWFDLAPLILQFVKSARSKLKRNSKNKFNDEVAEKIRLVGGKLPALYERITGNSFGISNVIEPRNPDKPKGVQDVGGVRFVRRSLEAMGLDVLQPETIASHWKKYRKASQHGGATAKIFC